MGDSEKGTFHHGVKVTLKVFLPLPLALASCAPMMTLTSFKLSVHRDCTKTQRLSLCRSPKSPWQLQGRSLCSLVYRHRTIAARSDVTLTECLQNRGMQVTMILEVISDSYVKQEGKNTTLSQYTVYCVAWDTECQCQRLKTAAAVLPHDQRRRCNV